MDAVLTPLLNEHLASWVMMFCPLIPVFFVMRTIEESNEEDGVDIAKDAEKDTRSYESEEKSTSLESVLPVQTAQ